jgi:hypothetical protein
MDCDGAGIETGKSGLSYRAALIGGCGIDDGYLSCGDVDQEGRT